MSFPQGLPALLAIPEKNGGMVEPWWPARRAAADTSAAGGAPEANVLRARRRALRRLKCQAGSLRPEILAGYGLPLCPRFRNTGARFK